MAVYLNTLFHLFSLGDTAVIMHKYMQLHCISSPSFSLMLNKVVHFAPVQKQERETSSSKIEDTPHGMFEPIILVVPGLYSQREEYTCLIYTKPWGLCKGEPAQH